MTSAVDWRMLIELADRLEAAERERGTE